MSVDNRGNCPRCKKYLEKKVRKLTRGDPKVVIHYDQAVYPCEIPHYMPDSFGNVMVALYDCKNDRIIHLTNEEFERRRQTGEV